MGPPRTRAQHLAAAQARSRFHEGSMNDRASAAPPVAFLGLAPAERAALEEEVALPEALPAAAAQKTQQGRRMALLGQVWEGVRGRLRLRRDAAADDARKKPKAPEERDERPSREDVLANYHQLVASGFFASHAIHATRAPGARRPSTSHDARPHPHPCRPHRDAGSGSGSSRPQWPLAPPRTPSAARASPVCSPASGASSRGTKRTAAEADDDEADADAGDDDAEDRPPPDEDASTLAHRFLPKRLRSSASRDISLPKLRRIASRRGLAAAASRRSISMVDAPPFATKRVPGASFTGAGAGAAPRCSLEVSSLRGRAAGDARPLPASALRPRASAEPLSVVPDANRGIPRVPAIPAKFTYGADRENAGPWRGLRR